LKENQAKKDPGENGVPRGKKPYQKGKEGTPKGRQEKTKNAT